MLQILFLPRMFYLCLIGIGSATYSQQNDVNSDISNINTVQTQQCDRMDMLDGCKNDSETNDQFNTPHYSNNYYTNSSESMCNLSYDPSYFSRVWSESYPMEQRMAPATENQAVYPNNYNELEVAGYQSNIYSGMSEAQDNTHQANSNCLWEDQVTTIKQKNSGIPEDNTAGEVSHDLCGQSSTTAPDSLHTQVFNDELGQGSIDSQGESLSNHNLPNEKMKNKFDRTIGSIVWSGNNICTATTSLDQGGKDTCSNADYSKFTYNPGYPPYHDFSGFAEPVYETNNHLLERPTSYKHPYQSETGLNRLEDEVPGESNAEYSIRKKSEQGKPIIENVYDLISRVSPPDYVVPDEKRTKTSSGNAFAITLEELTLLKKKYHNYDMVDFEISYASIHQQKSNFIVEIRNEQSFSYDLTYRLRENNLSLFGIYLMNMETGFIHAKTVVLMPKTYLDHLQYNDKPGFVSLMANKYDKYFVLEFTIEFDPTTDITSVGKVPCGIELTLSEDIFADFLKVNFVAKHCHQTFIVILKNISEKRLRFGMYCITDIPNLNICLFRSEIISKFNQIFVSNRNQSENHGSSIQSTSSGVEMPLTSNDSTNVAGDLEIANKFEFNASDPLMNNLIRNKTADLILDVKNDMGPENTMVSTNVTLNPEEVLSDEEMAMILFRETHNIRQKYENQSWIIIDLYVYRTINNQECFCLKHYNYYMSFPGRALTNKMQGDPFLLGLYYGSPRRPNSNGRLLVLMPPVYRGVCQHNQEQMPVSDHIVKHSGFFIIHFDLSFCKMTGLHDVSSLFKAQLSLPNNDNHVKFFKKKFVVQHLVKMFMITLITVQFDRLWFAIRPLPAAFDLHRILTDTSLISESEAGVGYYENVGISLEGSPKSPELELYNPKRRRVLAKKTLRNFQLASSYYQSTGHPESTEEGNNGVHKPLNSITDNKGEGDISVSASMPTRTSNGVVVPRPPSLTVTNEVVESLLSRYPIHALIVLELCLCIKPCGKTEFFYYSFKNIECFSEVTTIEQNCNTSLYLLAAYMQSPKYQKAIGKTAIVIPLTYRGFYQYDYITELDNDLIVRHDGYAFVYFDTNLSTHYPTHFRKKDIHIYRLELNISKNDYLKFILKELFVAQQTNQTFMVRLNNIRNNKLRFVLYNVPEPEVLDTQLQDSQFILDSKMERRVAGGYWRALEEFNSGNLEA